MLNLIHLLEASDPQECKGGVNFSQRYCTHKERLTYKNRKLHHTDRLLCTSDGKKKDKESHTHPKVLRFFMSVVAYALHVDYPTVIT